MYYESQGELGRRIAAGLDAGAATADRMNVGAIATQDANAAANSPGPNTGMIVQGTVDPDATPSNSLGITNPNYVDQLSTEPMYQGHQQAALAAGVGGVNAFGKGHAAWIANNKEQMIALGIIPSHKDPDGNLTGKYSSADWKAFQKALGQQVQTTVDDDTVVMEEAIVAQNGAQNAGIYQGDIGAQPVGSAGIYQAGGQPPAGHPDWGTGVAPNAGQQYTGEAPLPGYGQEMYGGQSQPWVEGQRPTPSNYEQASRWASGSFPVYGPQASGLSYAPESGSLSSAPPSGQRTYGGEGPINQETVLGYQPAYNTQGTDAGNIGTYGANIYSPMGETSEVGGQLMSTEVLQETISPNLNIEELRNTAISSGGTKKQRRDALSKAGMNKEMLDNMSDVDVAIWNYAIMEGGNERLQGATFESLRPRVQELKIKFNSDAGIYR